MATLALAMQAAHQGGIVHRDLKPGNILLTADGTPKVMADFKRVARRRRRRAGSFTLSGTRIGTPSPYHGTRAGDRERGHDRAGGGHLRGWAALLYEMLTREATVPKGETDSETERQVIHEEPVSPSRLNPKSAARPQRRVAPEMHLSKEPGASLHPAPRRWPTTCGASARDGRSRQGPLAMQNDYGAGAGAIRRRRRCWQRRWLRWGW